MQTKRNDSEAAKEKHLRRLIAYSFLLSILIGSVSQFIADVAVQRVMWAVDAFFVIIAASLLASKLSRAEHDIPAAGFAVITVAQAMSYGFIATHDAGAEQFGAVIAIFVPGLVLISFYDLTPFFIRLCGFISAAVFSTLAILIFVNALTVNANVILTSAGYMAMNVSLLGWAWLIYRKKI